MTPEVLLRLCFAAVALQAIPAVAQPAATQVTVVGETTARRLEKSANAVTVVDLARAKTESSDLGQVLARAQGVSIQRSGGLGSEARFSLGGFDEGQVRIFVDGVPIALAGYPFGLQNVPVNLARRIDIYKGVVPIRLGADALGGAFELITDHETTGTAGSASYQAGSFDTYRFSASLRHRAPDSGLFAKAEGFFDSTRNDYRVDVNTSGPMGEVVPASVYRFHDGYRAIGANLEAGVVDQKWAERLLVRGFVTDFDKDLQNNANMTKVYGGARYGGRVLGGNIRYENDFGGVRASLITGYAYNQSDWLDESRCVFNWFGQCVFERAVGGELGRSPSDRVLWSHTGYARWNLAWSPHPEHAVRLSVSPTYFARTGEERALGEAVLDRLGGRRQLLSWVNGIEYEAQQLAARLVNVAFFKHYHQNAYAKQPVAGDYELNLDTDRHLFGAGDGVRFSITDWLHAKASYEYAIRLPEPDEIFGNGAFIAENLELQSERSHNANLSLLLQRLHTGFGTFDSSVTGFFRRAEDLVVLLGAEGLFQYRNVGEARILGIEGMLSWLSPGKLLELSANSTYQDARNVSSTGAFGMFEGDRMPNRPYFFANASVRLQHRDLMKQGDELSLTWYGRYVHEFYLNWESIGSADSKSTVPAQFAQAVVLAYVTTAVMLDKLTFSAELQNLTDEKVYDFYGVQRPGRAIYFKATTSF